MSDLTSANGSKAFEITVVSGKGGTGKTSLTAALAHLASTNGRFRPLICDLDVDAPDLHLLLDPNKLRAEDFVAGHLAEIDPDRCSGCGTCEEMCRFEAVVPDGEVYRVLPANCEGCSVCVHFCPEKAIDFPSRRCGQWFVSQTRFGPMVHALLEPGEENSGLLVSLLRGQAATEAAERDSNLILADGSPGIGCPVISSLTGTDLAVMVTEPTPSGLHDLERVIGLAEHFKRRFAVVINKFDLNPGLSDKIEELARARGGTVLGRLPHDPASVAAMINGQTVTEHDEGPMAKEIHRVWDALEAMIPGRDEQR